jgi:hypothetical protein
LAATARQANTDRGVAARSRTTPPSSNELLAVAEHHWPNPGWYPSPPGRATLGVGCARWAWTHRPRRQAVGLVQQERQPSSGW